MLYHRYVYIEWRLYVESGIMSRLGLGGTVSNRYRGFIRRMLMSYSTGHEIRFVIWSKH